MMEGGERERLSQLVARWETELQALAAAQVADARRLDALDAAARRGGARLLAAHRAAVALEAPAAHLDRVCDFLAACLERLEARADALVRRADAARPVSSAPATGDEALARLLADGMDELAAAVAALQDISARPEACAEGRSAAAPQLRAHIRRLLEVDRATAAIADDVSPWPRRDHAP
jgi:hypothetical protein